MPKRTPRQTIQLTDTIGGTAKIRRTGPAAWTVTQRSYGEEHDNNQNPTWLRVHNAGAAANIRVRLVWATFRWMGYRELGPVKHNGEYATVEGRIEPTATTGELVLRRPLARPPADRRVKADCGANRRPTRRSFSLAVGPRYGPIRLFPQATREAASASFSPYSDCTI